MDVASPIDRKYCNVPAIEFITENSLDVEWNGFVWVNPPYSKDSKYRWLNKLKKHEGGVLH